MQLPFCIIARSVFRYSQCLLLPLILHLGFAACASAADVVIEIPATASNQDIQKALDHLPMGGGEVHLAAGKYVIREPLVIQRNHQTLRGSGPATVLQLAPHANCPVVVIGAPLGMTHTVSHARVSDVTIDGDRLKQDRETWQSAPDGSLIQNNGVTVWQVADTSVENVTCSRCRSGGLVCSHGNRGLTIHNFTAFDNHFDGLACYQTEDSHFTGLNLHDNLSAGISLDLAFKHNTFTDAKLTGNDLGIFMRDSHDNTFKTLVIQHSHHHGVFMAQAGDYDKKGWHLIPGTQCTGNKFTGLTITECSGKAFVVNDDSCVDNVITAAHFQSNTQGDLVQASPHLVMLMQATP